MKQLGDLAREGDADVLIGALDGSDAHHTRARALFMRRREGQDSLAIGVVNLAEVLVAPAVGASRLAAAREAIAALGVAIHQPSEAIAVDAGTKASRSPDGASV